MIHSPQFTAMVKNLYGNDVNLTEQIQRYETLVKRFTTLFGTQKKIALFSAPGRTEIAGNHTDHNNGLVIAAAINLDTIGAAAPTDDKQILLISEGFDPVRIDINELEPKEEEKGTTAALARGIVNGFVKRGLNVGGFVAATSTFVLSGSGLSSSAAIEVLIASILSTFYNDDTLTPLQLALIAREAENTYFGKPCGLMDQLACAHGGLIAIDFASPLEPLITPIDIDFAQSGYDLFVVNSHSDHADLTDEYAAIVQEMALVASYFKQENLRTLSMEHFMAHLKEIRSSLFNDRAVLRAYHYLSENRRVMQMSEALAKADVTSFLALVKQSGLSSFRFLQNVTAFSKEQSLALALAASEELLGPSGVSRVHGGGFAGTIQAFVPLAESKRYQQGMDAIFGHNSALKLRIRNQRARCIDSLI